MSEADEFIALRDAVDDMVARHRELHRAGDETFAAAARTAGERIGELERLVKEAHGHLDQLSLPRSYPQLGELTLGDRLYLFDAARAEGPQP